MIKFKNVEEYTTWLSWLVRNGMYIASDEHTMVRNLRITFSQQLKKFRPELYQNRDWASPSESKKYTSLIGELVPSE